MPGPEENLPPADMRRYQTFAASGFPLKAFPFRPGGAMTGSEFMKTIMDPTKFGGTSFADPAVRAARDAAILAEIKAGNFPDFLAQLKPVTVEYKGTKDGKPHTYVATFQVMPDYLAIGSNSDYVIVPMGSITAQQSADALGMMLPTAKMVDETYKDATTKAVAQPKDYWADQDRLPDGSPNLATKSADAKKVAATYGVSAAEYPHMQVSSAAFAEHNEAIQKALPKDHVNGDLVAGHKKEIVITNQKPSAPGNDLGFYGFYKSDGTPIQGKAGIASIGQHEAEYADYSHGVRLVNPTMIVDGKTMNMADVLGDPEMSKILNAERPSEMTSPRVPRAPAPPPPPPSGGGIQV